MFERQCCSHHYCLLSVMAAFTFPPHKPKGSKLKYSIQEKHGSQSYVVCGEGEGDKRSSSWIRGWYFQAVGMKQEGSLGQRCSGPEWSMHIGTGLINGPKERESPCRMIKCLHNAKGTGRMLPCDRIKQWTNNLQATFVDSMNLDGTEKHYL